MSPALVVIVLVVAVLAGTVALIVRGAAAGRDAEAETRRRRQERRSAGALPALSVREVQAADHAAWLPLWEAYCSFYGEDIAPEFTQTTWLRFLDPASPLQAWGAFDAEGTLVGFAHTLLHPHTWSPKTLCYLEDLYVSPAVRGRDVGHTLISFLWKKAEAEGWARLYWHTEGSNATARRLYDRFRPADGYVRYTLNP